MFICLRFFQTFLTFIQLTDLKLNIMKKLLSLLFVTVLFQVNAQYEISNPVSNVLFFSCSDYQGIENAVTVPSGKLWKMIYCSTNDGWRINHPALDNVVSNVTPDKHILFPEGTELFWPNSQSCNGYEVINVAEYNYSTSESLSYNDIEPIENRIQLFPNPTTNQLALNSDKDYQIEVFDLLGNKVMELEGNTINVEHLSSATYIVNAIDLETKESLSYKVVKK